MQNPCLDFCAALLGSPSILQRKTERKSLAVSSHSLSGWRLYRAPGSLTSVPPQGGVMKKLTAFLIGVAARTLLRSARLFCLAFLLLLASAWAQNFDRGFMPYQSYQGSGLDSVNLSNGNLLLHIPIISYPQRGTMPPLTLSLRYNNPRWNIVFNPYDYWGTTRYIATWQHDGSSIVIVRDDTYSALEYDYTDAITGVGAAAFHAVDSSGAHHVLEPTGASDPNAGLNTQMESIDATGLQLATGFVSAPQILYVPVIDPRGIRHLAPLIKQDDTTGIQSPSPLSTIQNGFTEITQDPSGNAITPQVTSPDGVTPKVTGWVDSIGR